eukprot:TRINITY_DN13490_c0_g1_i2.p1 TRINITY_DN13490_c0_g1~~TRINITY_DN13490_c0_g1_i2.p1  ORF type:complete len:406 (+),score=76.26 TRINITY_DN13490_c0_g1_i2:83-1300(+)
MPPLRKDVAIVGGGASALACSIRLAQLRAKGLWEGKVSIFEAAARLGGRCAVATTSSHYFDYGFQRFKNPTRKAYTNGIAPLRRDRHLSFWPRVEVEFDCATGSRTSLSTRNEKGDLNSKIFAPTSNMLVKYLYESSRIGDSEQIQLSSTVTLVQRWERDQWIFQSTFNNKWSRADTLVLACPPQAILPAFAGTDDFPLPESQLIEKCSEVAFYPQCVLLIGWDVPGIADFDVMHLRNNPVIAAIYNNNTKDMRPKDVSSLTVVATSEFSAEAIRSSLNGDDLVAPIGQALSRLPFMEYIPAPSYAAAHTWLHGFHNMKEPFSSLYDKNAGIGVCGDWTQGTNALEDAWASGVMLANEMAGVEDLEEFEPITQRNFKRYAVYGDEQSEVKDNLEDIAKVYNGING